MAERVGPSRSTRVRCAGRRSIVGCSQKGHHFGRPVSTTLPEDILVGPNALHFTLRAFGSMRMCHADVTGGTLVAAKVVPSPTVTDSPCPIGAFFKIFRSPWTV